MFWPQFKSFNWNVPNVNSNQCKVRVRDKIDNSIIDESDNVFSILSNAPKIIEVLSFNSSQSIPINSTRTIHWNPTGINNVRIEYTTNFNNDFNNPNDWQVIANTVPASSNSFQWNIPNIVFAGARIRITDVENENIYDINDMDFSTYDSVANPKNLKITFFNITLKYENTYSEIEVEYTIDNGFNWLPIDTLFYNGVATTMFWPQFKSFNWNVPNVNSNQCKVRVRDKIDNSINDESDLVFSIIGDSINDIRDSNVIDFFIAFPNPVKSQLYLESNSLIEGYIIFNCNGVPVHQQSNILNYFVKIDFSILNQGFYIMKILRENDIITKEIIKY